MIKQFANLKVSLQKTPVVIEGKENEFSDYLALTFLEGNLLDRTLLIGDFKYDGDSFTFATFFDGIPEYESEILVAENNELIQQIALEILYQAFGDENENNKD